MKVRKLFFLFCFFAEITYALAQMSITGRVLDPSNAPVIGATIQVKGSTQGVTADAAGNFTISAPSGSVLVVSYIGMGTKEVNATEGLMNIVLEEDATQLDEVMVVAYGTTTKKTYTGSAVTMSSKSLGKMQVSDASKALEGTMAGVTVSSASGSPGAATSIRIRGIGSVNAASTPLIIVDGSPYDAPISTINPADIQSYTVLKDASSAALYGARGANGVIVITTKAGRSGQTIVNLESRVGYNFRGVPEYDIMTNPATFYETMWQSLYNQNGKDAQLASRDLIFYITKKGEEKSILGYNIYNVNNEDVVGADGKINPNAVIKYPDSDWGDWAGQLYAPQLRHEHNLSITHGTGKSKTYFSAGYLDDRGYNMNTYFKRATTRLRYDADLFSWLKFNNNTQFTGSIRNATREDGAYTNTFSWTRNMPPIYPVYRRTLTGEIATDPYTGEKIYDDGTKNYAPDGTMINAGRTYGGNMNLVVSQNEDKRLTSRFILNNNMGATVILPYNFEVSSNLTVIKEWSEATIFQTPIVGDAKAVDGRSIKQRSDWLSINFNQIVRWSHSFKGGVDLQAMLGHESYLYNSGVLSATKTGFLDPTNTDLVNGTKIENANSYGSQYRLEGYFSQVSASYLDRYYISMSARMDGSSIFHPDHRWGKFWSVGGSWRIDQETFFSPLKAAVSQLKLKASYGLQGNDNLLLSDGTRNWRPYEHQYETISDGNTISLFPKWMGNKEVTWEKNYNFNVGLEFALWEGILSGEIEYFQRTTSDMLFNLPVPQATGFSSIPTNVGDMRNRGVEVTLNSRIIRTKNIQWGIGANLTHYKNVITRLPEVYKEEGLIRGHQLLKEGGGYL